MKDKFIITYVTIRLSKNPVINTSYGNLKSELDKLGYSHIGVKEVSEKASGQIVISSKLEAPQQLVKTTRFEAPNGHIYRIDQDITVPAAAKDSAGKL